MVKQLMRLYFISYTWEPGDGGKFAWQARPKLEMRLHILYQHCVVKLTAYDFRLSRYIMTSIRHRYHRLKTVHGTENPLGSHGSKNIAVSK
jgi:hypothetical protein